MQELGEGFVPGQVYQVEAYQVAVVNSYGDQDDAEGY